MRLRWALAVLGGSFAVLLSTSNVALAQGGLVGRLTTLEGTVATLQAQLAAASAAITSLQSSMTTLQGTVTALQANLASETAARQAADAALQTALNGEIAARQSAEATLTSGLTTAQGDITSLETAVSALVPHSVLNTLKPASVLLADSPAFTSVATMTDIPPGFYVIAAQVTVTGQATFCRLSLSQGGLPLFAGVQAESENAATLPLILAVQFTPGFGDGEVLLECSDIGTLGTAHASEATIVALPVQGITNRPSP